jgi:RNA polymerase sigma factor (sigma-70 family)
MKYPTTSKTLLDKLRSGDEISWDEFYAKYREIILFVGGLHGLNEHEQDDLLQRVMCRFFKNSETFIFKPEIARFRTYLGAIIKNCATDIRKERAKENPYELPDSIAAPNSRPDWELDHKFIAEWRVLIFRDALDKLKGRVDLKTFQAFELYGLQKRPAEKVAVHLGMKINQIYLAKNRCVRILNEIVRNCGEAEWKSDV